MVASAPIILEQVLVAIASGIYAVIIFIIVLRFMPVRKQLANQGIFNTWLVLAVLLFTFGYAKHEIGYYLTIESTYCKQTSVCENVLKQTHATYIDKMKSALGFMETIWLESVGEGVLFILVGMPAFIWFDNKIIAAFVTGILAHSLSDYSGLHNYFCRKSCSVNPLS